MQILMMSRKYCTYILQMDRFEKVADKMSYPQNLNSGRFIDQGNEQL
jgi:hypothetical protein